MHSGTRLRPSVSWRLSPIRKPMIKYKKKIEANSETESTSRPIYTRNLCYDSQCDFRHLNDVNE